MAESCIVCLGDLAGSGADVSPTQPALSQHSLEALEGHTAPSLHDILSPKPEADPDEDEIVAHLLPCGHNLHNECLKPWVERANSCPICRQSFNSVELSAHIGGPIFDSYTVQDKQQVAEIDPSMIIDDEDILEDEGWAPCLICDSFGETDTLMQCNSCEQLCHVFCAGLEIMPQRGPWYCQECMEDPSALARAQERPDPPNPRAYIHALRRNRPQSAYDRVWASVFNRTNLDLDFPFDDDTPRRRPRQTAAQREYERRLAVASRNGAGNRFRQTASVLLAPHRIEPPPPPDPGSQEEIRAWNLFDKAREELGDPANDSSSNGRGRRRKRKSVSSSPSETDAPQEPQRKLKRPRTRIAHEGESSRDAVAEASSAAPAPERRNSVAPVIEKDGTDATGGAPGFLQSLLKEVEVTPETEDEVLAAPKPRRLIIDRACSPPGSSPGLSPVYPTPRAFMTPPPLNLSRPISPQYSPGSTFPPFSPADDDVRAGRRKSHQQSPGALSSPPRSKDSSPTRPLSYSTKSEIQRMVSAALKRFYLTKEINKDQYTDINRDVSRALYDRVGDANALADQSTREKWQSIASETVETMVKAIRAEEHDSGMGSN